MRLKKVIVCVLLVLLLLGNVVIANSVDVYKAYAYDKNLEKVHIQDISAKSVEEFAKIFFESVQGNIILPNDLFPNDYKVTKGVLILNFDESLADFVNRSEIKDYYEIIKKNFTQFPKIKGVKLTINGLDIVSNGDWDCSDVYYFEEMSNISFEDEISINSIPDAPPMHLLIDPGHGGNPNGSGIDSGSSNWEVSNSILEKNVAYDVGFYLENYAGTMADQISFTHRQDDLTLSASERERRIEQSGADICVSLHTDAQSDGGTGQLHTANGMTTYYNNTGAPDFHFASSVHNSAKTAYFGSTYNYFKDLGVKYGNFYVLKTSVPACLVEMGYISNTAHDYQILTSSSNKSTIAYKIWLGIREYWWGY